MKALRLIDGETSQGIIRSIRPSGINLEKCLFYGFGSHEDAVAANLIIRERQAKGTWEGAITEAGVLARFSGIIEQVRFSSLVNKGYLFQSSNEEYFITNKFIEECYQAGLK